MKRDKKIKKYAKSLLKLCFVGGDFSEERAAAVAQVIERNQPRHYPVVLKEFLKLVQREIADRTAVVEHAGELSPAATSAIKSSLDTRYGHPIAIQSQRNPSLIAGVRVRVGCDVFESSIAASLRQLEASLS